MSTIIVFLFSAALLKSTPAATLQEKNRFHGTVLNALPKSGNRNTMRTKKEVISFDISDMQPEEIKEMFAAMPIKSLRTWLEYYEKETINSLLLSLPRFGG